MDHLSTQKSRKTSVVTGLRPGSGFSSWSLLLLLSILTILMAQCSAPLTHKQVMVANRPQKKVFKVRTEVLKEAVKRVLEKKKFTVDSKQSNQLHLQTEWLQDRNYRSMVVADIKPVSKNRTELNLHMLLEKKHPFTRKWKPSDEIGEDTYRILLGDIEMETYRVLYERT